jgi:hypothetical protein
MVVWQRGDGAGLGIVGVWRGGGRQHDG